MAKKKNKKEIAKRQGKAKDNKQKKRKLKLLKSAKSSSEPQYIPRPPFAQVEVPDGFRVVSISQAMVEYAQPLLDLLQTDNPEAQDAAFKLSTLLWNYSIGIERGESESKIKDETLQFIRLIFALKDQEAESLFQEMIDRKEHLFPKDIQPEFPMQMFMRKDVSYLIRPFDYNRLQLISEHIPASDNDNKFVKKIKKLDEYINDNVDYDKYEKIYLSLKDECEERFKEWLIAKGLGEYSDEFAYCITIYWDFIYGYLHDNPVILKIVLPQDFEEFFMDYVLRKVVVEPHEYVYWLPAIKLFYIFLYEKGYLDSPDIFIQIMDSIEHDFVDIVRKRFV